MCRLNIFHKHNLVITLTIAKQGIIALQWTLICQNRQFQATLRESINLIINHTRKTCTHAKLSTILIRKLKSRVRFMLNNLMADTHMQVHHAPRFLNSTRQAHLSAFNTAHVPKSSKPLPTTIAVPTKRINFRQGSTWQSGILWIERRPNNLKIKSSLMSAD